jgi:hypothetical protein
MATTKVNPKESKRSKTRPERAKVRTAKLNRRKVVKREVCRPLVNIFADRDAMVRRGEFEIIGQVMLLRTEKGDIDFFKGGPHLAQLKSSELVLLGDWQKFPDMVSLLADLCDDCRTDCKACDGKGNRLCTRCGGEGKLILSRETCKCVKDGVAARNCKECKGAGHVPGQTQECPECKGTKVQKCPGCHDSGRMTTGHVGGSTKNEDPLCESCKGNGRKLGREPQDYREFVHGHLEGFTVFGPIHGILLRADEMRQPEGGLEYCDFRADENGNISALLVQDPENTGQPMYLMGGVPVFTALK